MLVRKLDLTDISYTSRSVQYRLLSHDYKISVLSNFLTTLVR